ncbi:MAG: phosphatidylglycerophosphatase A family protein [Planktomarina sp.]
MKKLAQLTATVFYVGYLRPAPGTWGSLAGLALAALFMWIHPVLFLIGVPAVFIKGYIATKIMTAGDDDPDRSEIVIDEVFGQWVALTPVAIGTLAAGTPIFAMYPGWIVAFIAFRLFDIWKPGPIGRIDAKGTPMSVMMDDGLAGLFAAIVVLIAAGVSHGVLM